MRIEARDTENNSKYANRIIKQSQARTVYAIALRLADGDAPYKIAHGSMPFHSAANPDTKQIYIDGRLCCAYKFGIVKTAWALSAISISIIKNFLIDILKLSFKRNRIEDPGSSGTLPREAGCDIISSRKRLSGSRALGGWRMDNAGGKQAGYNEQNGKRICGGVGL